MSEADLCRSVLIEVLTVLAKDMDKVALVGGWVPELVFPGKGHIGSLDVDLALDPRLLKPLAYESIRRKLLGAGYEQDAEMPNRFFRPLSLDGQPARVKVDLITGEFAGTVPEGTHVAIQELAVWKARGVDLAFDYPQEVAIEGSLPDGAHNRVTARLPRIPAYLCIKAITLSERMKEKDAYDIYFCVDQHAGGYRALAASFQGMLTHSLIAEGVAILREKFARPDSIGPVWAGRVAGKAGRDEATERRRAFEIVDAMLRLIGDAP